MKESKFKLVQEIKDINVKNTYSWYSDLYKQMEMHNYVAATDKGVTVLNTTVGVGR